MTRPGARKRAVGSGRRRLERLLADRHGSALVELAIIGSVLCTLTVGISDFGLAIWKQTEVSNAARAGVQYVSANGWNQSAAQTAATSATSLAVTATATTYCGCPTGTGITQQTCGTTCSSYSATNAGNYASVTAQASYTPLLRALWSASPVTLSATAVTRY
jgi:Flp pilus assembly protein TadG